MVRTFSVFSFSFAGVIVSFMISVFFLCFFSLLGVHYSFFKNSLFSFLGFVTTGGLIANGDLLTERKNKESVSVSEYWVIFVERCTFRVSYSHIFTISRILIIIQERSFPHPYAMSIMMHLSWKEV